MAFQAMTSGICAHHLHEADLVEEEAEQHRRNGAEDDQQRELAPAGELAPHKIDQADRKVHAIPPEIDHHRQERPHVHHDVGQQPLVRPAGQRRNQQQMARGGDRQEFGDALDESQYDDLEYEHENVSLGAPGLVGILLPRGRLASYTPAMNRSNRGAILLPDTVLTMSGLTTS
jgi:hypothetical protein